MLNRLRAGYYRLASLPLLGAAIRRSAPAVKSLAERMTGRSANGIRARLANIESQLAANRLSLNVSLAFNEGYARFCPAVSLIICTCDRAGNLREALHAACRLAYPKLEIICVNGPSKDGTAQELEKWRGRVTVCDCPERNISMSRNIGIAAAGGEIVAFMDDDAIPRPDWLMELVRAYADESVAAAGGFIRDATGRGWQSRVCVGDRFGDVRGYAGMSEALGAEGAPETWGKDKYFSPTGTNMSFRRSALLAIGGFDENYAYHLDETDVFMRLAEAGRKMAFSEFAEVTHKMSGSGNRGNDGTPVALYHHARSKTYFSLRHAAPAHGREAAEKRLAAYLGWLEASAGQAFSRGRIDKKAFERLMAEVAQGRKDGEMLACAAPMHPAMPLRDEYAGHEPTG